VLKVSVESDFNQGATIGSGKTPNSFLIDFKGLSTVMIPQPTAFGFSQLFCLERLPCSSSGIFNRLESIGE